MSLGTTREEAVGRNIKDYMDADEAEIVIAGDKALLDSNESFSFGEFKLKTPHMDQAKRLGMSRLKYISAPNEAPSIYAFATDITDTLNAADEAKEASAKLQLLPEFAGVGFWEVNLVEKSLTWSDEVFRIHGVDPKDGVPDLQDAVSYYHPDDIDEIERLVFSDDEENDEFLFVKRIIRKSGEVVKVTSHGLKIKGADGKIKKVIGIFQELKEPE